MFGNNNITLKYLKEYAVMHTPLVCMLSVDDKAIVPVGEPEAQLLAIH